MDKEKILELAAQNETNTFSERVWAFDEEALLAFAQSVIEAERERIKSRVKEAAESLWCIRNQVGDEPYGLYIGPSLNTMGSLSKS